MAEEKSSYTTWTFIASLLLLSTIRKHRISFGTGVFLSALFFIFIYCMRIADGFYNLYISLNFPLRGLGINIPFFPLWIILGGYIYMGIFVGILWLSRER